MGTATVELYPSAVSALRKHRNVRIVRKTDMGDGVWLLHIESDLLPPGYNGQMDAILEGSQLRFRRSVDT